MYNKSLIKNFNKIKNIKMLTQANSTLGKQAKKTNATATNLSSSSASSSMLSSLIFAMTLLPAHHRHHQQQQLPKQKQHKFQRHPQTRLSFLSCSNFLLTLIFPLILFCHQCPSVLAGSCREAQLCCNGRDSSCVVQKAPINAIIEDLSDKPCYCDHACLKLGDCCSDFKDHCGVLDCQVSDWGQWSDCSTACGSGIMTRTRQVLQAAQNGGKHCPVLIQKRGCQGFRCHGHHDKKILRETALLLPASLTHKHHANDSSVRRNLRNHYRETYQHNREQEYCVEFEVLRTSKSCHKLPPYNLLIEGDRIVVRCDVEAFIQDFAGSSDNNALTSSTLKSKHHNDTAYYNKLDLIDSSAEEDLNDSDENMIDNSSSSSSSSDEHDDYDTASLTVKTTTSTTTTTTTTTTTPYPPPQPIQYHCRGEGLPGRTTRWSALAAPSCRGKWLRLTLDTPKKCSHAQFIFV